jgi:hypothetical protein
MELRDTSAWPTFEQSQVSRIVMLRWNLATIIRGPSSSCGTEKFHRFVRDMRETLIEGNF